VLSRWRKAAPENEAVSAPGGRGSVSGRPTRPRVALIVGGVAVTMASSLSALSPGRAAAQALPPECSLTGPGSLVTCKYFYTGHSQKFTVPVAVIYLFVGLIGAAGGTGCGFYGGSHNGSGLGGAGAELKSEPVGLPARLGRGVRVLHVNVGGRGEDSVYENVATGCRAAAGGFNGGAHGGHGSGAGGGGGGGASDIRFGAFALDERLETAAGGGGGGSTGGNHLILGGAGGAGGATGKDGVAGNLGYYNSGGGGGGQGATPTSPGAGGDGGVATFCNPSNLFGGQAHGGRFAHGGAGAGICSNAGGGGGGGVYGGGGGGAGGNDGYGFHAGGGGGGGGGSSAGPSGARITSGVATPDGNGRVTIAYYTTA
jgi:hypothetical protein